tara:strand:- start:1081 stop:1551 length:471 start_codon:yes stop_codon:yes gene_type:complete
MPSFLKKATTDGNHVELKYTRYIEGDGYVDFTECFDARPIGGWSKLVSSKESMRFEQFLDTMVEKTITTRRVMALIELDNVLCENKNIHTLLRIMNTAKIIDPTFTPPFINTHCGWQKRLVMGICHNVLPSVIETCSNEKRLERMFNVMRLIESEI